MNTENSITSKPHNLFLSLSQGLDFKNLNKYVTLQNLSIYYTWENMRQQYKDNKIKVIAPRGMMNLNCLMVPIQCQIFKVLSRTS